jgi:hypothetical protein
MHPASAVRIEGLPGAVRRIAALLDCLNGTGALSHERPGLAAADRAQMHRILVH